MLLETAWYIESVILVNSFITLNSLSSSIYNKGLAVSTIISIILSSLKKEFCSLKEDSLKLKDELWLIEWLVRFKDKLFLKKWGSFNSDISFSIDEHIFFAWLTKLTKFFIYIK